MEPARKFKIIVNSKECGTCSGPTPSAVAKKVVKKLCGSSSKVVRFSLKECKRGCERVCGPYQGRMEKLDRPYKRDGKTITHRVVCGKVRKMRGGDLGNDGENLIMDDFKVKDESVPFLRLETIGKLGKFGFGSTKEQYAFFNPQNKSNNNELNNNERSQAGTELTNQSINENPIYYQYVAIRKRDKDVVFKKCEQSVENNSRITEVNISEIDTNILLKLLNEINEEIKKQREKKKDFAAKSILEILDEYLKNKIKSNLKNDTLSWKLFKITEQNPSPIKYFSFGKKTSKFLGNKNQYIFFDIVELYPRHYFYQYVVIRDENKNISLKKIVVDDNTMEILDLGTFDSVSSNKSGQGQLILEKLHRDILMLIDTSHSESSNFATTIRQELSRYTFGDKETDLFPDSFLKNQSTDDFVVKKEYVFFSDILLFKKCKNINNITKCEYTDEEYDLYKKYYMYVIFLDKNNKIIFKQLKLFKGMPIILEVDMKDYIILEWLYSKINHLCDSKNNYHLFGILFALENFSVHQERTPLKSRDFYITSQEQKETIRILTKKKKTFIFFKRLKGRRTIDSNEDFILYEYAIIIDEDSIIDEDRIEFYTIKDPNNKKRAVSILIKNIREINIDDIDVLLLTLLYEELIKISDNDSSRNNLKKLKGFLEQKIGKYYEFKKKVEKILRSNIKNNKITINGKQHNITYDGQFTFNFFDNKNNSGQLKDFLKRILKTKKISMLSNFNFGFKPNIKSITSNNVITSTENKNENNYALPQIISTNNQ